MGRTVGRYALFEEIASGGMATVHLARLRGEEGFSRVVAIKVLHAQYAKEESFRAMFLDEARLVARIRHPNVVGTLDVLQEGGELFLVMEYVRGESLSHVLRAVVAKSELVPLPIASALVTDVLEGLHAAHETTNEDGEPLSVVHRDVSPHNVLVGVDGIARVADFGVAKAVGRLAEKFSSEQTVKGKASYMAPEQARGVVDRRSDVFAAGVVLWEVIAGKRLFTGDSFMEIVTKILDADVQPPSVLRPEVTPDLDAVVMKALAEKPSDRFATASEMALALERAVPRATPREVGAWVQRVAKESLERHAERLVRMERDKSAPSAPLPGSDEVVTAVEGAAGVQVTSPSIQTVSGIAPDGAKTTSRTRWPWAALVVVAVASTIAVTTYNARHGTTAISAVGATAPTNASSEPTPLLPTATSLPVATEVSTPVITATTPPTTTHRAVHPSVVASTRPPKGGASCDHYTYVPDVNDPLILIPVCQ